MPFNSTLRARLFLVLAVAILPMVLLAIYLHGENRERALRALETDIRTVMSSAAVEQDHFVDQTHQVLRIMARADDTRELDSAECAGLAGRLLATQTLYVNLGAADASGRVVCSGRPMAAASVAGLDWFEAALSGNALTQGHYESYESGPAAGRPVITFGYGLADAEGLPRGVLFASADPGWLDRLLAALRLPRGWAAAAVDREGRILARRPPRINPDGSAPAEAAEGALAELIRGARGGGSADLTGADEVRWRYAYAPLASTGEKIFLAVGGETAQVTAPVDRQMVLQLALIGAVALLSFLAAWFGIHTFLLRWSRALQAAARRFGAGDFEARFRGPEDVAELAEIGHTFDRMAEDICARERACRRTEEDLRLAARVFESSRESIMITDASSKILAVNRSFSEITGYTAEEAVGQSVALLKSGRHDSAFYAAMWDNILSTGSWQGEIWDRRKDGALFPAWLSITAVRDAAGEVSHYIGITTDITEQRRAEERIRHLAYYDALTGLPNRTLLADRVAQVLAIAERDGHEVAVMFIDLDQFKTINDSLGHSVGDVFLQAVAGRVRSAMREADTVARIGGDEFVIILPETGAPGAAFAAEKLLAAATAPYHIGHRHLSATLSIGISIFPADADNFEALMQHADTAMFRAKESGRNRYQFFRPEMNAAAFERLSMENGLRRALDEGEFLVHYQPQVDIGGRALVGMEALLRWRDPEAGLVPPGRFIPVAESSGLITPIGEWVLREACRQARAWQAAGLPVLPVAVNLSAHQFRHAGFEDTVARAVSESGLDPACLELELTEGTVMEDTQHTLASMARLKDLGVGLSIDDFGTGYSSLSYLKRFPIDKLKIDQSFVRDITTSADDLAIANAVISMGHSLRLAVVAEGVETRAQLEILSRQGCDHAQGYHFGRPMPAHEMAAFLGGRASPH